MFVRSFLVVSLGVLICLATTAQAQCLNGTDCVRDDEGPSRWTAWPAPAANPDVPTLDYSERVSHSPGARHRGDGVAAGEKRQPQSEETPNDE